MSHPPVQDWLPAAGAGSLHTVRRHIQAETTTDTDAICATVSRNVFFAVPLRTREGNRLPPGTLLTSYDEVYDYYARRADQYVVRSSCQLRSVCADWFVFNESAATLHPTDGPVGEFVVNSAILFPTASDGIRGEICITRHPFEDVAAGRVPAELVDGAFPAAERENAARLDAWLEVLRSADGEALGQQLSSRHALALRLDGVDGTPAILTGETRDDARGVLSRAFAGDDVAILCRVVSAWYVFAEYAVKLPTGGLRRIALLQSTEAGALGSSFGYGFETPPA